MCEMHYGTKSYDPMTLSTSGLTPGSPADEFPIMSLAIHEYEDEQPLRNESCTVYWTLLKIVFFEQLSTLLLISLW